MKTADEPAVGQKELVLAWRRTLPEFLPDGDEAEVWGDEVDPNTIRIHIRTAADHRTVELDFSLVYVDSREVDVRLADVDKGRRTAPERSDDGLQELVGDYRRHLHECAQALQPLTRS
jgi:hypothetical protein